MLSKYRADAQACEHSVSSDIIGAAPHFLGRLKNEDILPVKRSGWARSSAAAPSSIAL